MTNPFPKLTLELKYDHYALIEDIRKSVTSKLKAFPISDFAQAKDRTPSVVIPIIPIFMIVLNWKLTIKKN